MLQSLGYETEVAGDALEAERRMLDGAPFNLIVSDNLMPGMFGVELAMRTRDRSPRNPRADRLGVCGDNRHFAGPAAARQTVSASGTGRCDQEAAAELMAELEGSRNSKNYLRTPPGPPSAIVAPTSAILGWL